MHHHGHANSGARNPHRRGNQRNAVAGLGQCDQRLRSDAFKQHARPDVRDLAGSLEPAMRREAWSEAQQRLVGKLGHLEHDAAAQPVSLRQHGQDMHRIEQSAAEAILAGRHDGNVEIAALEAARQAGSAVLDERNLDAGVTLAIAGQELREQSSRSPAGWRQPGALRPLQLLRALARAPSASASDSRRRLRTTRSSPSAVSRALRPMRANSRTPNSSSSAWICRDAADWVRLSRAAARAKPALSAIATKVRRNRRFIAGHSNLSSFIRP